MALSLPLAPPTLAPLTPPSAYAFVKWWDDSQMVTSTIPLENYPEKRINCEDSTLYPAFPQQDLKQYSKYRWGEYDQNKLAAHDEVCDVASQPHGRQNAFCLRADVLFDVVLSDIFEDACGNLYRAFKEDMFLKKNETMGTLFSPGRASYPDPKSEFAGTYIPGGTYSVKASEFLKIGAPSAQDETATRRLKEQAIEMGYTYDSVTHLYKQN